MARALNHFGFSLCGVAFFAGGVVLWLFYDLSDQALFFTATVMVAGFLSAALKETRRPLHDPLRVSAR